MSKDFQKDDIVTLEATVRKIQSEIKLDFVNGEGLVCDDVSFSITSAKEMNMRLKHRPELVKHKIGDSVKYLYRDAKPLEIISINSHLGEVYLTVITPKLHKGATGIDAVKQSSVIAVE